MLLMSLWLGAVSHDEMRTTFMDRDANGAVLICLASQPA